MDGVRFLFSKDDLEMFTDLEKTFGKGEITEEHDLIGETIAIFAIPGSALAFQILDFILTHIKTPKKGKNTAETEVLQKRRVEIKGKRITLTGYTAEEVIKICQSLGLEKQDER